MTYENIVPEHLGIRAAQTKTPWQIHEEIRAAQEHGQDALGGLSGITSKHGSTSA